MAQKAGKEETEFKVPEVLTLCINNCGVTGNPATNNMCQKCFTSSTAEILASHKLPSSDSQGSSSSRSSSRLLSAVRDLPPPRARMEESKPPTANQVNRCSGCWRKVGLTGFRCRCGDLFCSEHRYSDRHDCSYDYRSAARETIARENPVVKPAKIIRL